MLPPHDCTTSRKEVSTFLIPVVCSRIPKVYIQVERLLRWPSFTSQAAPGPFLGRDNRNTLKGVEQVSPLSMRQRRVSVCLFSITVILSRERR